MSTKLKKKEKGFVKSYLGTGNGTLAVRENYDVANDNVAGVMAHRLLKKAKIQDYIADHAEDAEAMIYKLSQTGEQESIRLNASKDILDRAGFVAVAKSESTNTNLNVNVDMKPEEQEALLGLLH